MIEFVWKALGETTLSLKKNVIFANVSKDLDIKVTEVLKRGIVSKGVQTGSV